MNPDTTYFDFSNVRLVTKECIVDSRKEVDTTTSLGNFKFKLPIVPANMVSTINENLAIQLAKNNYFYIYHRFHHNNLDFVRTMNSLGLITSISVGVNKDSYEQLDNIKKENLKIDFVTIDIANGFYYKLAEMAQTIRKLFPDAFIIGGNVGSPEGVAYVEKWCDCAKFGQGPGKCCSTVIATSAGTNGWQAKALYEASKIATKPLMGDGGIRTPGECSVGMLFCDFLMVGSMLSNLSDSPGELVVTPDGKAYKEIFGSASSLCSKNAYIEGHKVLMEPNQDTLIHYMNTTLTHGMQSAISYIGGKDLTAYNTAEWVIIK
jgi:GMP reductase